MSVETIFNLGLIQVMVLLRSLGYKGKSVVVHFEEFIGYYEPCDFTVELNGSKKAVVYVRYENNAVFLVNVFDLG